MRGALAEIGSSGHLDAIYSKIEGHPKTETNPTWRDTVRRTLQQYSIFYQKEKGSGIWYLKEEKPLGEFDPKKNPNPGHDELPRSRLHPPRRDHQAPVEDEKHKRKMAQQIRFLPHRT